MTEPVPEASDADLADFPVSAEADVADLLEQHRSAPLPDDDYER